MEGEKEWGVDTARERYQKSTHKYTKTNTGYSSLSKISLAFAAAAAVQIFNTLFFFFAQQKLKTKDAKKNEINENKRRDKIKTINRKQRRWQSSFNSPKKKTDTTETNPKSGHKKCLADVICP